MTILEALYAEVDPFSPNRNTAIRALEKVDLTYTDTASDDHETAIGTAAVDVLSKMLVLGGESEGGFSQSFNEASLKRRIQQLCDQYGLDASTYIKNPSVDDASFRW